jgi:predicted nucleotidyltransferase
MGRTEIVERIRARAEAVKALGATALYIYGSRARGDERPDGDLDVFVDFDPEKFGLVELVELEDMLARELGLNVQLATRDALHPLIKSIMTRMTRVQVPPGSSHWGLITGRTVAIPADRIIEVRSPS